MIGMLIAVLIRMFSDGSTIEPVKIPITASDSENHRHTLYFGFHPGATYGFDEFLGETPIPPVPTVQAFDVRFLDPFQRKQFAGDGGYSDIRRYVSRKQVDTFHVRAQPTNESFPMTFSWPDGLGANFDSIILEYQSDGSIHRIDMTQQTTFNITKSGPESFMIVTSGLKGALPWKK